MSDTSAEQKARDLLERYGVSDAQTWSAGDLVELANLIDDAHAWRRYCWRRHCEYQVKLDATRAAAMRAVGFDQVVTNPGST